MGKRKLQTNYQRGANFERHVKELLETNLRKMEEDCVCFLVRAAGSRGPLDILLVLTDVVTRHQKAIGFQCKIVRPSYENMQKEIAEVKYKHGIDTYYVYRNDKKETCFYPSFEVQKLIDWRDI